MQQPSEMAQATVQLDTTLLPGEVLASALEHKTLTAASQAANYLNINYRKSLVEVLRTSITLAPDGGVDVKVLYDRRKWSSPGSFMAEFVPLLREYLFK